MLLQWIGEVIQGYEQRYVLYREAEAGLGAWYREHGFKVDNSHHHHTVFQWQGFTVENHYDFVNVHVHESSRELESILPGRTLR